MTPSTSHASRVPVIQLEPSIAEQTWYRSSASCGQGPYEVDVPIGGATYGVAKQVRLYAVKVLNCSGSGSTIGVVSGINYVRQSGIKPAVANMSLGGGISTSIDNAVTNAVNSGIVFAVAAGNTLFAFALRQ